MQSDMLECEACVAKLDCTIDLLLDPEEVGKMADTLVKQLTDQHTDGCAWREKVCPERFSDGPTGVHAKAALQERCQAVVQAKDKLPRIVFKDATHSKRVLHVAQGVLNRGGGGSKRCVAVAASAGTGVGAGAGTGTSGKDDGSVVASYILGLCGWQTEIEPAATGKASTAAASTSSPTLVLQCGFCRMKTTVNATNVVQWPPKQGSSSLILPDPPTSVFDNEATGTAADSDGDTAAVAAAPTLAGSESPEPIPKLERKLTPKQHAAASIKPERRFGVPVAGDRQRLKRMLSGSSSTSPSKKKTRSVAIAVAVAVDVGDGSEIDLTKIHRAYCPYLDDGWKSLTNTASEAGASSRGGATSKNAEDSAQAALRLVRSL